MGASTSAHPVAVETERIVETHSVSASHWRTRSRISSAWVESSSVRVAIRQTSREVTKDRYGNAVSNTDAAAWPHENRTLKPVAKADSEQSSRLGAAICKGHQRPDFRSHKHALGDVHPHAAADAQRWIAEGAHAPTSI